MTPNKADNLKHIYSTIKYAFFLLNREFYKGKLPRPAFLYLNKSIDEDLYAEACYQQGRYAIRFYPLFISTLLERGSLFLCTVLLHEMAHIAVFASRRYDPHVHGELFKKMCELHGLRPIYCGEELGWAETEIEDFSLAVYSEITESYNKKRAVTSSLKPESIQPYSSQSQITS